MFGAKIYFGNKKPHFNFSRLDLIVLVHRTEREGEGE